MKQTMKIITIVLGLGICMQSVAFAKINNDLEQLLIQGDEKAFKEEMKVLYRENKINSDELIGLLDFIDIGVLQSIASFNSLSEAYLKTRENNTFTEASKEFKNIKKAVSERQRIISQGIKYLSERFVDEYNGKIKMVNENMAYIASVYNEEIKNQREEQVAFEIEEKIRKEEIEKMAMLEAQRQKQAEEKYRQAIEWAKNNSEYKMLSIICDVCQGANTKKEYEKAIETEKQYSERYGVINLSRIEEYKVGIIRIDSLIKERTSDYRSLTGKQFNFSECDKETTECQKKLEYVKQRLVKNYLAADN